MKKNSHVRIHIQFSYLYFRRKVTTESRLCKKFWEKLSSIRLKISAQKLAGLQEISLIVFMFYTCIFPSFLSFLQREAEVEMEGNLNDNLRTG
jgi:hypothetical protein